MQCSGQLYINDIHGNRQLLRRLEPHQAETTLGVDLAPNGDTSQQAEKMRLQAIKWADAMRTGKISRNDAWTAVTSTIWRTLSYQLPALNLTMQQCDKIMSPVHHYGLPAMSICCNFPWNVVFSPIDHKELGWTHLHSSQEIMLLQDIIKHTFNNTTTGELCRSSLELMLIELGMGVHLKSIPYPVMAPLASNSLVKGTWKFLSDNKVELHHEIKFHVQKQGDDSLMHHFVAKGANIDQLPVLNRCCLHLQVYFISDLVDDSGIYLLDDAWNGKPQLTPVKQKSWP